MDTDVLKYNTLGKMLHRVVRGVLPSVRNSERCSKVYVQTSEQSDASGVKDYLVQAQAEANLVTGTASFTKGSKQVKLLSSSAQLAAGDAIRLKSSLKYIGVASAATDTVTLLSPWSGDTTTVPFVARVTSANRARMSVVESSELSPGMIGYSQDEGRWVTASSAVGMEAGPLGGLVVDGITLKALDRASPPIADVQSVGSIIDFQVDAPQGYDSSSLPLPAVPYPPDQSGVSVTEAEAGSTSYKTLGDGEYFVDYTGSPVPSLDQPPFRSRKQARLFRAKTEQAYVDIRSTYGGQWAVQDSKVRHTSILFGTEQVSLGDASNPAYVSEEFSLTEEDLRLGKRELASQPVSKVVLNISEGPAQSDGLDFIVAGSFLIWKGYGLESEAYLGMPIRLYYQAAGSAKDLYPYLDYLLDPGSGTLTTVKQQAGAVFTVQYVTLSPADMASKYVALSAAPLGAVAVNVASGPPQREGVDFQVKGNRLDWSGLGMDVDALSAGTILRVVYQSGSGEAPIEYMLTPVPVYDTGVRAYRSSKPPASLDVYNSDTWGDRLELGVDWTINCGNGSFMLLGEVEDGSTTMFEYHSKAESAVTETLDPWLSPSTAVSDALRTRYSPVVPHSATVHAHGAGGVRLLKAGVDYHLNAYNGIFTCLKQPRQGEKWNVVYLPAIAYYVAVVGNPTPGSLFKAHVMSEPARILDSANVQVFNKQAADNGMDLSTLKAKTPGGAYLTLSNVRFDKGTARLSFDTIPGLVSGAILELFYEHQAKELPFAPMVELPSEVRKDTSSLFVDGSRLRDTFEAGQVLGLSDKAGGLLGYFAVRNVLNSSGENIRVMLGSRIPRTCRDPQVSLSSKAVAFGDVEGLVCEPYSKGQGSLYAEGMHDGAILPGSLLMVGGAYFDKEEVYKVLSSTYDSTSGLTRVDISPPAVSSESRKDLLERIMVTGSPVYMAGDTALVTRYPVLSDGFPLWKIDYVPDSGGYATVQINKHSAVLREHLREGTVEHKVQMYEGSTVDDLAQAITALSTGRKFSLKWLYPRGAGLLQANLLRTKGELRLPVELYCLPQVMKRPAGGTEYSPLKSGTIAGEGDYHVVGRNIVLSTPIAYGDAYTVAYVGVNNLAEHRGRSLQVTSKRLVPIPSSTSYRVGYEYLREDQYLIQTMTAASYLTDVVKPEQDSAESAREGASPFGCLSVQPRTADLSSGGLQDSLYLLREEQVKLSLFRKAFNFYEDRIGAFSTEYAAITGKRPFCCDYSADYSDQRRSVVGWRDLELFATFGESRAHPSGREDVMPTQDGRLSGFYRSFGSANVFNAVVEGATRGVMLAHKGNFLTRGIKAGDKIRVDGRPGTLVVHEVVTEEELTFEGKIPWKGLSGYRKIEGAYKSKVKPLFSWMGSPTYKDIPKRGARYWVESSLALPCTSFGGCPTAIAHTEKVEPFELSEEPSPSNVLCVETSEDGGAYWVRYEVDLSFLDPPYTAARVAAAIGSGASSAPPEDPTAIETVKGLGEVLDVYAEPMVVPDGVDVPLTLSAEWPLAMPTKEGSTGHGNALVFRALHKETWVRFVEPVSPDDGESRLCAASSLGLPVDTIFKGASDYWCARKCLAREQALRQQELSQYAGLLSVYDITDRGEIPAYAQPLALLLAEVETEEKASLSSLLQASGATVTIMAEKEANEATAASYAQASSAATIYAGQLLAGAEALAQDSGVKALLGDPGEATRWLASLSESSLSMEDANESAMWALKEAGRAVIRLSASAWPGGHVALGRGPARNLAGYSVAPVYASGSTLHASIPEATEHLPIIAIEPARPGWLRTSVRVFQGQLMLECQISEDRTVTSSLPLGSYVTVAALVSAVNREMSGLLVASLHRGSVTPGDYQALGTIPTSRLLPTDAASAPCQLAVAGRPYTDEPYLDMELLPAATISKAGTTVVVSADLGGLVLLRKDASEVSIPVEPGETLGAFAARVASEYSSEITMTLTGKVPPDTPCQGFVPSASATTSQEVYLSVNEDIAYWVVSDKNLRDRIQVTTSRVNQDLVPFAAKYDSRAAQIEQCVGDKGEDLHSRQHEWLCLLADKEIGPCTRIPQLKKRIMSSKLYKEYLKRT